MSGKEYPIPEVAWPMACRRAGCLVGYIPGGAVYHDDDEYHVSKERLNNPNLDIWGDEIKPWLMSFHRAEDAQADLDADVRAFLRVIDMPPATFDLIKGIVKDALRSRTEADR